MKTLPIPRENYVPDVVRAVPDGNGLMQTEHLLQLMPAGVVVCDVEGLTTFCNRRAVEVLGREPPLNVEWWKFCADFKIYLPDGTLAPHAGTPLTLAARQGRSFRDLELMIVRPDGSAFAALANIDPLRDANERLGGAIMVFQDVTARKEAEKHAAMLVQLSAELAVVADEADIVSIATRLVGTHLGVDRCYFAESRAGGKRVFIGQNWVREGVAPLEGEHELKTFSAKDWTNGQGSRKVVIADTTTDVFSRDCVSVYKQHGIRACATIPFIRDGRCVVKLTVTQAAPRVWREDELAFLDNVVARVWPMIERARAGTALRESEERLRAIADKLELLNRVGSVLAAERDLGKIIQEVADIGSELCGAAFSAFFYGGGEEHGLAQPHYILSAPPSGTMACFPMPKATPLTEPMFNAAGVVRLEDVAGDARFEAIFPHRGLPGGHHPLRSFLAVPVKSRSGEVLGGLFFGHPSAGVFAADVEGTMLALAAQAAIAIDNANLYAALQRELAQQKESQEASRRLAAIVESSEDAIIAKTLHGIVTNWNQAAERIFGYTADEMIGQSITKLIPPDAHTEEQSIIQRLRLGEHIEHYETVRRHRDGHLLHVSLSISPIRARDGRIIGVSKIARDITGRKTHEAQQQTLHELVTRVNRADALPEIYDAAIDAICRSQGADRASILLCDAEGVMRFKASRGLSEEYRAAVEGHSPWAPGEADPQPVWIDDIAAAQLDEHLREVIEREGIRALVFIPLTYEKRLLGKFMIYYNTPHRFSLEELRPVGVIASQVAFAIERRRSAEALEALVDERTASLRQAVAQMEEFSYSVSHDLRSPARAMCGYAEAVLHDYGAQIDEEGRTLLLRIQRNGARMDRLIQDLLTYSRVSVREISFEPVELDRLLPEVIHQYPEMNRKRADIELGSPLPRVLAHEPSLTQVVSNLLSNAVKFVAPGVRPRVRVHAEQRGTNIRLWFEDNGIGIAREYQPKLFGMFERIHPAKQYEGTGIGLAIVRKAIERMHGTVGVESDGKTGSRFWVELPVAPS